MVDAIVRLTVAAVAAVALLNLARGTRVGLRLARHASRRAPRGPAALWLPLFGRPRDVAAWWADWRAILAGTDPVLAALRVEAAQALGRHLHLAVTSHAWGLAVTAVLAHLG